LCFNESTTPFLPKSLSLYPQPLLLLLCKFDLLRIGRRPVARRRWCKRSPRSSSAWRWRGWRTCLPSWRRRRWWTRRHIEVYSSLLLYARGVCVIEVEQITAQKGAFYSMTSNVTKLANASAAASEEMQYLLEHTREIFDVDETMLGESHCARKTCGKLQGSKVSDHVQRSLEILARSGPWRAH